MNKIALVIGASIFTLLLTVSSIPAQAIQKSDEQKEWIADSLKEMEKIKVGMTRGDLLRVFTTLPGISTGLDETYGYRKCPWMKVDVEFEAVGRPARDSAGRVTLKKSAKDTIKSVSKPYVELIEYTVIG